MGLVLGQFVLKIEILLVVLITLLVQIEARAAILTPHAENMAAMAAPFSDLTIRMDFILIILFLLLLALIVFRFLLL